MLKSYSYTNFSLQHFNHLYNSFPDSIPCCTVTIVCYHFNSSLDLYQFYSLSRLYLPLSPLLLTLFWAGLPREGGKMGQFAPGPQYEGHYKINVSQGASKLPGPQKNSRQPWIQVYELIIGSFRQWMNNYYIVLQNKFIDSLIHWFLFYSYYLWVN